MVAHYNFLHVAQSTRINLAARIHEEDWNPDVNYEGVGKEGTKKKGLGINREDHDELVAHQTKICEDKSIIKKKYATFLKIPDRHTRGGRKILRKLPNGNSASRRLKWNGNLAFSRLELFFVKVYPPLI